MLQKESWIKAYWRPTVAYAYVAIILFDFIVGPIFWSVIQTVETGNVSQQWVPLTLSANGFFYIAMGAILGVNVWSRGREKIAGVAGDKYPFVSENS